jgi:hypothetical protein
MTRAYRTKAQQAALVALWRASGKTRAAFCASAGISPATFTRWLAGPPATMTFTEVLPPSFVPLTAPAPVVVVLPGGVRLVVEAGSSMSLVAELARVLG